MRHPLLVAAALTASALALAGCGVLGNQPSPVSTYVGADGEQVTVDWADYPGEAGQDSEALRAGPDQDEIVPLATDLVNRVRVAVELEADTRLIPTRDESEWFGEESWFSASGNGYGGETMLVTVNCCELQSGSAPSTDRWRGLVDAVSAVTEEYGLGPVVLQHEAPELLADDRWRDEYARDYCNGAGGRCWLWSGTAYANGQWLSFSIQDARLDTTGAAMEDAEEFDWPVASVSVSFGATTIASGRRDDFERTLAPFEGLDKPDATTSD